MAFAASYIVFIFFRQSSPCEMLSGVGVGLVEFVKVVSLVLIVPLLVGAGVEVISPVFRVDLGPCFGVQINNRRSVANESMITLITILGASCRPAAHGNSFCKISIKSFISLSSL